MPIRKKEKTNGLGPLLYSFFTDYLNFYAFQLTLPAEILGFRNASFNQFAEYSIDSSQNIWFNVPTDPLETRRFMTIPKNFYSFYVKRKGVSGGQICLVFLKVFKNTLYFFRKVRDTRLRWDEIYRYTICVGPLRSDSFFKAFSGSFDSQKINGSFLIYIFTFISRSLSREAVLSGKKTYSTVMRVP